MEYIVATDGKTYTRHPSDTRFLNKTGKTKFNTNRTDCIAYQGKNEIKAKYIALKTHYNNCVERGETNEYGMVMLYMDVKFYEEQYPQWCI